MTVPPWPDTHKKKKKRKKKKTCCVFVNSPFHVPTPGCCFSPPCIATSNRSSQANSHPLYPRGGSWLSQRAHLPCCFYYDSHLSLPLPTPVAHLSSPDSQDTRCHDTSFYRKGWRDSLFIPDSLHVGLKATAEAIDVLAGVMTQEVRLSHCEKVCACVGAHNISNLWSFPFTGKMRKEKLLRCARLGVCQHFQRYWVLIGHI